MAAGRLTTSIGRFIVISNMIKGRQYNLIGSGSSSSPASRRGFTIVELLIVIVVIAILAAISVVAYTGVSNRANDSVIQSDLANFAKAAQLFHAENGVYPTINQMGSLSLSVSKDAYDTIGYNLYYCTDSGTNSKFSFAAKSKSGNNFYASSAGSGPASIGAMSASRACGPIDVVSAAGQFVYGYHSGDGTWRSWTN